MAKLHGEASGKALAGIRAIRDHLLGIEIDFASLPDLAPEAMASAITLCDPEPVQRERILRGMTLVAIFDGPPTTVMSEV